jgi:hypothetical protein
MMSEEALNDKRESCWIGEGYQTRFWCGFCRVLIDLKIEAVDSSNERFDHIDYHFIKEGKTIETWMPINQCGPPCCDGYPVRGDNLYLNHLFDGDL